MGPVSISWGPKTPPFRATAIARYLQITYFKVIKKEKGDVCVRLGCSAKIRNSDRLYHSDTLWRVASGPGADFWEPSKSRGVPKTVPKIEYGAFLAPKGDWKA